MMGLFIYNELVLLNTGLFESEKEPALFVERNNQFSLVCSARVAEDCSENGGWCDTEEEAQEWVEDECWIFSGEGWICFFIKCIN